MTDRTPAAIALSLTLHALVAAIVLLFTYSVNLPSKDVPKIFDLVQGEGNNYMATKAPAIGSPDAVKLNLPAPSVPKPEPATPEAAPVMPTPVAPPVTKAIPPPKAPRTPAQEIRRLVANAELRAEKAVAKERKDEQDRMTKAEFDRQNKAKNDKSTPPKIAKVDGPGIAKGVAGGSPENTKGGAGGKALTADEGNAMQRYESALIAALRKAVNDQKVAGVGDMLVATVQFHVAADGTLSAVRIVKPSGSREFDDAVRAAFRSVGSIGKRPDGKAEDVELDFLSKDQGGD